MPEVQNLKKKKNITKGSVIEIEENSSLNQQFEVENPTLCKFIENSKSLLQLHSLNGQYETIIKDPDDENPIINIENKSVCHSNILVEEIENMKIESELLKQDLDDKPCYSCKKQTLFNNYLLFLLIVQKFN